MSFLTGLGPCQDDGRLDPEEGFRRSCICKKNGNDAERKDKQIMSDCWSGQRADWMFKTNKR